MDILDDGRYNAIISWLPTGDGFIIHDKKRFSEEVMPVFFKQSQYSSFVRRMSRWKFALVREGHKKAKFFHPLFVRGAKHNAGCIRPVRQKRHGEEYSEEDMDPTTADLYHRSQRDLNIPRHISNPMENYNNGLPGLMSFMNNQTQMSNPSTHGMGGTPNLLHQGFMHGFNPQMTPEFMHMQMMMNQANYMQQMQRNQEFEAGFYKQQQQQQQQQLAQLTYHQGSNPMTPTHPQMMHQMGVNPDTIQQQQQQKIGNQNLDQLKQQDQVNEDPNDQDKDAEQTANPNPDPQNAETQHAVASAPLNVNQMQNQNPLISMNGNQMSMNPGQGASNNPMFSSMNSQMQFMQMNQGMMFHGQGQGLNDPMTTNQGTPMQMMNPSIHPSMGGMQMRGTSGYEFMAAQATMGNYPNPSLLYANSNGDVGPLQPTLPPEGSLTDQQHSHANTVSSEKSDTVSTAQLENLSKRNGESNPSVADVEV